MQNKKTIVLGASDHPERYAYKAVRQLIKQSHDVIAIGNRKGIIDGLEIHIDRPVLYEVDTVSLYLNPEHQKDWYNYILSIYPRRIIFNPGAENPEFKSLAESHGIIVDESCTLVLLSTNQY